MSHLRIASWNVEGRLSGYAKKGRGTPGQILDGIEEIGADVLFLPEAYFDAPAEGVDERLKELGYKWHDVKYDDVRERSEKEKAKYGNELYMRVLSRLAISDVMEVRWADARNMMVVTVKTLGGGLLRLFSTHLDERSPERRNSQLDDMIPAINRSLDEASTVALGDFNQMWQDGRGRLIGSTAVRYLARLVALEKLVYLNGMAREGVLERFVAETSLYPADVQKRPTMTPKIRGMMELLPSVPVAQIDHMFLSPDINVNDFEVMPDGGSDHRAIVAEVTIGG